MAKNIWICSKSAFSENIKNKIYEICDKLSPDNIVPSEPKVVVNGNIAYGIMNPQKTLLLNGNSLLMGKIIGDDINWHIPNHEFPDGSYALFRDGDEYCEIVSDPVASRTIWYYMNEELFVAATSQRAIILFIGEFEFNEKVIPWMLSNGTLGPSFSWDKRINCLPPDSSIILNKKKWSINSKSNPIEFCENNESDKYHEKKLRDTLSSTFKSLKLDYDDWVLTLSGGYDCRGILCLLRNTDSNFENLKAITWGLESSMLEKKNDAYIAKKLAKKLNIFHRYFHTDLPGEPIEKIINRFLLNGEGRIDHISGYMDGFNIWKNLHETGVQGTIRGDEGFGCKHYSSLVSARINQGCGLCSDFSNLKDYRKYGLPEQELPQYLKQNIGETVASFRDRLFHQHALPTTFSALSDLKLAYVEVFNPLLSRTILHQIRLIPDHLRTEKLLFKKIVISLSPKIAFATELADARPSEILKQKHFVDLLKKELSANTALTLFSSDFLKYIIENIKTTSPEKLNTSRSVSFKHIIKSIIPSTLKNYIRKKNSSANIIDFNVLAFRIYIILKMNKILREKQ